MVGTPKKQRGLVAGARVEHRVDVEARAAATTDEPANKERVQPDAQAVTVEDGKGVDEPVVRVPPPRQRDRLTVGEQVGWVSTAPLGAPVVPEV